MIYQQTTGKSSLLDAALFKKLEQTEPEKNGHDKLSFLIVMLAHLDLVPRIDVALILQYFDHLDMNHVRRAINTQLLTRLCQFYSLPLFLAFHRNFARYPCACRMVPCLCPRFGRSTRRSSRRTKIGAWTMVILPNRCGMRWIANEIPPTIVYWISFRCTVFDGVRKVLVVVGVLGPLAERAETSVTYVTADSAEERGGLDPASSSFVPHVINQQYRKTTMATHGLATIRALRSSHDGSSASLRPRRLRLLFVLWLPVLEADHAEARGHIEPLPRGRQVAEALGLLDDQLRP